MSFCSLHWKRLLLPAIMLAAAGSWSSKFAIAQAPASVEKKITVDGLERKYLVFAPKLAKEPMPVVLAFHGSGGIALQMEWYSRFDDVATKEGFLVIYPEAVEGNWNDGRGIDSVRAQKENIDDVKFVRALVYEVGKQHKIDRSRVFATGISNGGFLSHRLAAEASDLVDGIAPVVGGMAPAIAEEFKPEYPVSVLIIQGDADPVVPIEGGEVGFGKTSQEFFASDVIWDFFKSCPPWVIGK